MLHDLVRDARHAVRQLLASPTFTLVAVVTLALGVGANSAIFSVVHALLLKPLPYEQPERLLFVEGIQTRPEGEVEFQLSYPDIQSIKADATGLAGLAPWNTAWGLTLEGTDGARRLQANFVGADYFKLIGATPFLGRTFAADDHAIGANSGLVVILSEATWRQDFGADPEIIGRGVRLQNRAFTVVGVMPATFTDVASSFSVRTDVWSPIERAPELFGLLNLQDRGGRLMWGVARLADGISIAAANAELDSLGRRMAAANPATNTNFTWRADAMANRYFRDTRQPLWFLLAGSAFVLFIGCANIANLLLVRSSNRAREFAVRQAIGASTGRIVRQLLVESTVLAMAGAAAGLMLAAWVTPLLVRLSGIDLPAFVNVEIDVTVLAMTLVTALICGLLFGLAPIWKTMRSNVRDVIASGGRGSRRSRTATWLVGVEVTAAFVLAAGALLMLQSFSALTRTDLSFRSDQLLTVRLELPAGRYGTPAARAQAGEQLLERLRVLPGVEHATIWGPSMFGRSTWIAFLSPTDRVVPQDEQLMVWRHSTNPGALRDLGIRILAGRDLAATDTLDTPFVAVLSEAAAARLWPGRDPVGRQVRPGPTAPPITIVGVAADARHRGRFRFSLGAAAHQPQLDIYMPYAQRPNSLVTIGIRTAADPNASTATVRAAIGGLDPSIPIYDIASLEERMKAEESPMAFAALLLNLYASLAVLLAAVGVYGVLAAAVAGRAREIGIRSALGAAPRQLLSGVVAEGLSVTAVAIVVGGVVAWALVRSFSGLLFGIAGAQIGTLAMAAAVLVAMAVIASLVPAKRAASIDPIRVLRND